MTEPLQDVDALNAFNATVVEEFRANGGNVGDQFEGADLLLLTTTGRFRGPLLTGSSDRSGRRRLGRRRFRPRPRRSLAARRLGPPGRRG